MTPMGNLVVLWGGGLLLANILFDPIFASLRTSVTSGSAGASDLNTSPVHMVLVGLLTLLVLSFLANTNPKVAKAVLWAFAGLTVLWLVSYNEEKATGTAGQVGTTVGSSLGDLFGNKTAGSSKGNTPTGTATVGTSGLTLAQVQKLPYKQQLALLGQVQTS